MLLNDKFFQVLQDAGQMMLNYQHPAVHRKDGHANFVTEADEAVQAFLFDRLHQLMPEAAFLGEEGESTLPGDGLTFVIDPIDGTTNYFRGRNASVVSVGLIEGKKPIAGAIWNPYTGCMYHAEKGQGARCNGERLHVSEFGFEDALIEFGSAPYRSELNHLTALTLEKLLHETGDVRRSGSAANDLCMLASGKAEGMFEWSLMPWDHCAGALLVCEAGGRAGCITGGDPTYDGGIPFMAANARCFDRLRELLLSVLGETTHS